MDSERWRLIQAAEDAAAISDVEFKRLEVEPDWAVELKVVNGDRRGLERQANCQRCAVAHEMRMRGFDVVARLSSVKFDGLWKAETWLKVFDGGEVVDTGGANLAEVTAKIDAVTAGYGDGARAVVWYSSKSGHSCHVMVAERRGGMTRLGDPQHGLEGAAKCFKRADFGSVKVMRVDGLKFTEQVRRCCENLIGGK